MEVPVSPETAKKLNDLAVDSRACAWRDRWRCARRVFWRTRLAAV